MFIPSHPSRKQPAVTEFVSFKTSLFPQRSTLEVCGTPLSFIGAEQDVITAVVLWASAVLFVKLKFYTFLYHIENSSFQGLDFYLNEIPHHLKIPMSNMKPVR